VDPDDTTPLTPPRIPSTIGTACGARCRPSRGWGPAGRGAP